MLRNKIKKIKDIVKRRIYRGIDRLSGRLDPRSIEVIMDEEIERYTRPNKKIILYVGKRYDYGKKDWGLSYDHIIFYYTLLRMDYSLIYFDYDRFKQKYGSKKMSQILREVVYCHQPDILFYSHTNDWVDYNIWEEISNELPTKTIVFLSDDHMQYEKTRPVWKLFNIIVTTDKNGREKRRKEGFNNVFLAQYACNHFMYKDLKIPRIYDVTFVGRCYGERKDFVNKLRKEGVNIKTFGQGWENDKRISRADLIKIYNQSKISLNLSLSYGYIHTIKGRDFEAPACDSLLLTKESEDIKEYFIPDKEIITYKDVNDAAKKIKYYLKHGKEREIIAQNGYDRILRDHTYEKRLNEIFNFSNQF
jgi:spore maturation protein CgeB